MLLQQASEETLRPPASAYRDLRDALAALEARRSACEDVLHLCGRREKAERLRGLAALEAFPIEWTHHALYAALEDRDPDVRAAAAGVLAERGDERAIAPLLAALRASFSGGSARRNLIVGWTLIGLFGLLLLGLLTGVVVFKVGGLIWVAFNIFNAVVQGVRERRRKRGSANPAILDALGRIAERCPTPELRAALPDLQVMAADAFSHDAGARRLSRETAARIADLTERLKHLPLAAHAATAPTATLPRPSEGPHPDDATLPRVDA